jgi:acetylornithine deacetylase/succinyl-diaminopimelate desuccinylase-like protein
MDREVMLRELSDFLAIPSVSALPAHAGDCRRAAEWLRQELTRLGCPVVDVVEGHGLPVVWAESPKVPGKPTLLIYGHYDVQPPDPLDEWISPPFQPTVRDGKLFGRGTADDKGQVYCLLKAYESVLSPDRRPPLNVRFVFEGEEESGGHMIYDLLRQDSWRTEADAVLVCDSAYYAPGLPAVYTGLRGICYAEISVRTLRRDLHSGGYGGVAPNAIETLVRILSRLKDESGEIRIPNLYEVVEPPSKREIEIWK